MSHLDLYRAVALGSACGDATGWPTEFLSLGAIRRRYGPHGLRELPEPAIVTDDTQMMLALGQGILDACGSPDPEITMAFVAERFAAWSISPDNNRAPGSTCMAACAALRRGASWKESGIKRSKGCGAVMRVQPIALAYTDREELATMARASAVVTHGHPAALAAAHGMALALRLLIEGIDPADLLSEVRLAVLRESEDVDQLLARVPLGLDLTLGGEVLPEQVLDRGPEPWRLGQSWIADEALASALYCFLLAHARSQGVREAIWTAINTAGDSDTLGCCSAALGAARFGLGGERGLPVEWAARVEYADELERVAQGLHQLSLTRAK